MILYKLTDANGQTRDGTQWGEGVSNTATGEGAALCTSGVIHGYRTALIAVFMGPAHTDYLPGGYLWESVGEIIADDGLKVGCKTLTTLRRVELPRITLAQTVVAGILCAKTVPQPPQWRTWADDWLSGADRSEKAASAASAAASAAAWEAASAATWARTASTVKPFDLPGVLEQAMKY